jgi:TatD DNase family protein
MFLDSHCHLADKAFDEDRQQVLANAREAGLHYMLTIACNADEIEACLEIAEANPQVFVAAAQHPHEAEKFEPSLLQRFAAAYAHPKVIGIGEIGLDYWYDFSPRQQQEEVLRLFFRQALALDIPVIIHLRDPKEGPREASDDFRRILDDEDPDANIKGILHCYSGTLEFAQEFIQRGFLVSLPGILTFKKAEELRNIATTLPLESLLVETDCPYLAPVPFRGKRNEPAYVVKTAEKLAELRQIEPEDLDKVLLSNFKRLFPSLLP